MRSSVWFQEHARVLYGSLIILLTLIFDRLSFEAYLFITTQQKDQKATYAVGNSTKRKHM